MAKTYPCVGDRRTLYGKSKHGACVICGQPVIYRIDIQTSIFRGEDEVVKVCESHKLASASDLLSALENRRATSKHE